MSWVALPEGFKRDDKILVVPCTCGLSTQKAESEGWQIGSPSGQPNKSVPESRT